jgi:hypothetical protein
MLNASVTRMGGSKEGDFRKVIGRCDSSPAAPGFYEINLCRSRNRQKKSRRRAGGPWNGNTTGANHVELLR